MQTLNVGLGTRSYPIYTGPGLLDELELFTRHISAHQVFVVTNETVGPLYLDQLTAALTDFEIHTKVLADGEQHKDLSTLATIFDALLETPCDRNTTVIALGGGVVGDMAGFAAACYQRGIPLIQVPTTLLAQVDSSVGGKTAVNHPLGKNMIGAFYQPTAVIADINTLHTLPDRELKSGIAEVIKYGLIRDYDFFVWLEENIEGLLDLDADCVTSAIGRSCRNKVSIVEADELERGERALLNFGHTFGHAIETATGYSSWLHGEAVAAGMMLAADMSARMGSITDTDLQRIHKLLTRVGLPVSPPENMTPEEFRTHMAVDKKVEKGNIRLVLLQQLGRAYVADKYDDTILQDTLRRERY